MKCSHIYLNSNHFDAVLMMRTSSISNYPQLNKELAVNRDTGKKHQGEAPSEKLVRKFKENPFLPIGGKL